MEHKEKLKNCTISIFEQDDEKLDYLSEITKINRSTLIRLIIHHKLKNFDIGKGDDNISFILNNITKGD